jgi:AcrR family transcriptional regulator
LATAFQAQEKTIRRVQIMDAAEAVFLERGIAQTTMAEIARAATISKGALYLVFERKEDLYLAIAQRCLEELIALWTAVEGDPALNGFERFKALVEAYLIYALEHRDRFRIALGWSSSEYALSLDAETFTSKSPAAIAHQQALSASFRPGFEALEMGKHDGSVRPDLDTTSTLFHVWNGTVGVLMSIYGAPQTKEYIPAALDYHAQLVQHVAALLMNVRTAPQPVDQPGRLALALEKASRR